MDTYSHFGDMEDFINMDSFLFALNLDYKIAFGELFYDFKSLITIPVNEPFNCGSIQSSEDYENEEERLQSKKELIKNLKSILQMRKEEKKKSKMVYGVLGKKQYYFFKSVLPEDKVINVSNYSIPFLPNNLPKDYLSKCENEKHALFHVKRIRMFRDMIFQWNYVDYQPTFDEEKKDHFISMSNKWYDLLSNSTQINFYRNILSVEDFIYAKGINDNDKSEICLFIACIKSERTTTIFGGENGIVNFLNYYSRHSMPHISKFFAVLDKEQLIFFKKIFLNNNPHDIKFINISLIPDEKLEDICQKPRDVEYQARRINLLQKCLKNEYFPA